MDTADRVERERQYHNQRWADAEHDERGHLDRWYMAVSEGMHEQDRLIREYGAGKRVLEIGCADGQLSIVEQGFPRDVGTYCGIDISDVAIGIARARADERGFKNCRFEAMNAEKLEFPDGSFDLVFARGVIHHLDVDHAFADASRVVAPGGKVLFYEPLGHNPLINAYRRSTPEMRTVDERPLLESDLEMARKYFRDVSYKPYGLTTVCAVPLGGTPLGRPALKCFSLIDKLIFAVPGLRRQAWYALIEARK